MIKKLALIILPLFIVLAFVACEKEYSSENETGSSFGTATYSFAGSPSTCTSVKLNGDYIAGVALDTSNRVEVTVNVTKIGTYIISTATFNGVSFFGTGTFTTMGNHTVILYGDGTPVVAKTYTYPVGLNGCTFNVTFKKPVIDTGGGTAVFSYSGAPGNCINAIVEGAYKTGTPFDITNVVKIKVNVTTPGTYNIVTNSTNGFAFSASGVFATAGEQTVTLQAAGLPAAIGNNTFIPTGNGCSFVVNVIDGAPSGDAAIFSLNGAPAACTGAVPNGTYTVGTPLNASNTVLISANVTKVGTYAIATTTVNGFSFSASGTFTGTGSQPVTLTGIGTPVTIGPFNFTAGATGCTFTINCNSAVTTANYFYEATIDGVAFKQTVTETNGFETASFNSSSGDNYVFGCGIESIIQPMPTGTTYFNIEKGIFKNFSASTQTQFKAYFGAGSYPFGDGSTVDGVVLSWGDNDNDWSTLDLLNPNAQTGSNFTITKVEEAPLLLNGYWINVYGTFSCKLYDGFGNVKNVTNGKFCIPFLYE